MKHIYLSPHRGRTAPENQLENWRAQRVPCLEAESMQDSARLGCCRSATARSCYKVCRWALTSEGRCQTRCRAWTTPPPAPVFLAHPPLQNCVSRCVSRACGTLAFAVVTCRLRSLQLVVSFGKPSRFSVWNFT